MKVIINIKEDNVSIFMELLNSLYKSMKKQTNTNKKRTNKNVLNKLRVSVRKTMPGKYAAVIASECNKIIKRQKPVSREDVYNVINGRVNDNEILNVITAVAAKKNKERNKYLSRINRLSTNA